MFCNRVVHEVICCLKWIDIIHGNNEYSLYTVVRAKLKKLFWYHLPPMNAIMNSWKLCSSYFPPIPTWTMVYFSVSDQKETSGKISIVCFICGGIPSLKYSISPLCLGMISVSVLEELLYTTCTCMTFLSCVIIYCWHDLWRMHAIVMFNLAGDRLRWSVQVSLLWRCLTWVTETGQCSYILSICLFYSSLMFTCIHHHHMPCHMV